MLKAKGRLIVQSTLNHSYPYCWRFVGPLLCAANFVILNDFSCAQVRYPTSLPRYPCLVRSRATDHGPTHAKQCRDTLVSQAIVVLPHELTLISAVCSLEGSRNTSRRGGSVTGSLTPATGISRGIGSGGRLSRCGFRTITRRYARRLLAASLHFHNVDQSA